MICLICLFWIFKLTTNYPANVIQSLDDVKRQSRLSEIDANGLNIVRDINCWLRYEIKNGISVGYSSRNAGCT